MTVHAGVSCQLHALGSESQVSERCVRASLVWACVWPARLWGSKTRTFLLPGLLGSGSHDRALRCVPAWSPDTLGTWKGLASGAGHTHGASLGSASPELQLPGASACAGSWAPPLPSEPWQCEPSFVTLRRRDSVPFGPWVRAPPRPHMMLTPPLHRPEAVPLPRLQQRLLHQGQPEGAHAAAHGRQALPVPTL